MAQTPMNPVNPLTERSTGSSQPQGDRGRERQAGFESPVNKETPKPGMGDQIKAQAGAAMETAKDLADGAKSKVQDVMEAGTNKAEETKQAAGHQMHAVAGKIRQGSEMLSEKADQLGDYLEDHDLNAIGRDLTNVVRKYPLQSLLIGIGLGLLLGRAAR
jgi:hypothetical protein